MDAAGLVRTVKQGPGTAGLGLARQAWQPLVRPAKAGAATEGVPRNGGRPLAMPARNRRGSLLASADARSDARAGLEVECGRR